MWINDLQNRFLKDSALFFGLMAVIFIAAAYVSVVIVAIMGTFALVIAIYTVKDFIRLRHYARILPRHRIHDEFRRQRIIRPLANHLLRVADVPTRIPAGAMNALLLGDSNHVKDGSPLDWPVFWDSPDLYLDKRYYWRRTDKPIVAVQNPDGTWECQSATY